MSNHLKSIIFAAVLSIVCGSLLTLASTGLKQYQLKNIAIDKQKNILKSVGLIDDKKSLSPDTIVRLYTDNIKQMWIDFEGKIVLDHKKSENNLPVYLHVKQGDIKSYILPVDSRGLWGRILGYLAIKSDGITVSGFTVYSIRKHPVLAGKSKRVGFRKTLPEKRYWMMRGTLFPSQ